MEQSIFSWAGHPAKVFQSQDSGKDSKIHAETLLCHILDLLKISNQSGSFLKMSLACCHQTTEKILVPSSEAWGNWGMGSPTEFLTLNGAEHTGIQEPCRSADGVCSLSDVLEISFVILFPLLIACLKDWRIKHSLSACKKREVSVFGSVGGHKAKARLDAWNGHGMVLDLKTTRDLACDFEKSIANFGYGLQAAWYREVLRSVFATEGRLMPDDFSFVFLVVETTYPHGTAVYRMSDEVMDCYSDRLVELQKQWWECVMKNEYSGWPQTDVVDIGLPAWALKKLQEQR